MKAITYDRYTAPDGLTVTDRPLPEPGEGQVRIKVAAASLNAYDWHMYRAEPYFMRLQVGMRVKQPRTVGADVAGTVEAVGAGVKRLKVGDRVFGSIVDGACAEFAVADETTLAALPTGVAFADGAASAMAGITALQALRDAGGVESGARVLVWGAAGGVGHMAVQIARALGATQVDAVASRANADWLTTLGADRVFAYDEDEAPESGAAYDVVIDTVSTASLSTLKGVLTKDGKVVIVGALGGGKLLGPMTSMVGRLLGGALRGVKVKSMLAETRADNLAQIAGWLADGSVEPRVAGTYALADTADACRELEGGHVAGKLVVTL